VSPAAKARVLQRSTRLRLGSAAPGTLRHQIRARSRSDAPHEGRQAGHSGVTRLSPVRLARAMGRQGGQKGCARSLKRFGGANPSIPVRSTQMGDWGGRGGGAWSAVLLVVWPVAFDPDLELV